MAEQPTDAELLARHVAGDREAFGTLVQRHRDRLWAVALRTLGDREEAADALQDALVSAFRSAGTFQGRSAVTTWLHRIVVNACLDRARRSAARPAGSLDEEPHRLETALGSTEAAEATAVRAEVRREVVQALTSLPLDQRAALVLVDMQGYSVAEAAEVLGVPVGTVKSRCARGRARLLPLVRHLRSEQRDVSRETVRDGGDVSRETTDGPATVSRETSTARSGDPDAVSRETSTARSGDPDAVSRETSRPPSPSESAADRGPAAGNPDGPAVVPSTAHPTPARHARTARKEM